MKFTELELDPKLQRSLSEKNFTECTPIQESAIPILLRGRDFSGLAQTGTGKTGAFLVPMIARILASMARQGGKPEAANTPNMPNTPAAPAAVASETVPETAPSSAPSSDGAPLESASPAVGSAEIESKSEAVVKTEAAAAGPAVDASTNADSEADLEADLEASKRALPFNNWHKGNFILILVPTRELADQVHENAQVLNKYTGLNTAVMYGGVGYDGQKDAIKRSPEFVVATPGRLIDLYKDHLIDLKQVRAIIFDEADRMFDMGFKDDMKYVLQRIPNDRQFLVFSATLNFDVLNTAYQFGADPVEVNLSRDQAKAENVEDKILHIGNKEKPQHLLSILKIHDPKQAIVFTNFKNNVERVAKFLALNGYKAIALSSLMNQTRRNKVIQQFKSNQEPMVMVATDVAARGLDIQGVDLVINFELPSDCESYVHRIGRTGRAGNTGKAFSFVSDKDVDALARIEDYLKNKVSIEFIEDDKLIKEFVPMPKEEFMSRDFRPSGGDRGSQDGGQGRNTSRYQARDRGADAGHGGGSGGGGGGAGPGGGSSRGGRRGGRNQRGRRPQGDGAAAGGAGRSGEARPEMAAAAGAAGTGAAASAGGHNQQRRPRHQRGSQSRSGQQQRDHRGPAGPRRTGGGHPHRTQRPSNAVATKPTWSDKVARAVMKVFNIFKKKKSN